MWRLLPENGCGGNLGRGRFSSARGGDPRGNRQNRVRLIFVQWRTLRRGAAVCQRLNVFTRTGEIVDPHARHVQDGDRILYLGWGFSRDGRLQPLTAGGSKAIAWDINGSSAGSATVGAEYLATWSGPVSVLESGRDRVLSATSVPSLSMLSETCSVCWLTLSIPAFLWTV